MEQELINQLKEGNDSLFKKFYLDEMDRFVSWIISEFRLTMEEAKDCYQESQMHLYENIIHGRLVKLDGKLSTYLYAIAKNQMRNRFRKLTTEQRHVDHVSEHFVYLKSTEDWDEEKKSRTEKIEIEINRMLDPCRTLLILFYYENLGFKEIAKRLGYKNDDVAKNQKKRCLDKLRTTTQN